MSTRPRDRLILADEVALLLVTAAAIVGMHRLFEDGSFRGPLLLQALLAHVVVTVLRRLGLRIVPAALITAGVAALIITWTRFPETTQFALPSGETLRAAGDDLQAAWRLFGKVRAPAPVSNGFIAASAAAIWALVFVADWAAFRVSATFEALLPATTLFVFAAALGGPGSPIASAAVFGAAVLLFVLLHRTSNQERTSRWAGEHRLQGRWSLLGTGTGLIALAVVAGAVVGPQLPGASADALLAWRDLNRKPPARIVPSPLVDLRTKWLDQPEVELFTVISDQKSYWRLTSLDRFDGELWRQSYSTTTAAGDLPRTGDDDAESTDSHQRFEITALASVWLPAAYRPVAIDTGQDNPADYDRESSTLMVDRDVADSDGFTYEVDSVLPQWTGDELRSATTDIPEDIQARYLDLPRLPANVENLAHQLTDGKSTEWDKALAIQDYLRGPDFTYNQQVGPGQSTGALEHFLFESKEGYCEQFAGSFAVLAREAGIPSRVAVGFTWGTADTNTSPTTYRVRAEHAHAWPEIYVGQYGWVPLEPTPGRGPPGADNFLNIGEAQSGAADVTPSEPRQQPDTTAAGGGGDIGNTGDLNVDRNLTDTGGGGSEGGGDSPIPDVVATTSRPLLGGLVGYVLIVPLAIVVQRFVRRRRASTPAAGLRLGWQDATEYAGQAGVLLPTSLTMSEVADRTAATLPEAGAPMHDLAHLMEKLAYAEEEPTPEEAEAMAAAVAAVRSESHRRQRWYQRIGRYLDVRRLVRPGSARLVATQGPTTMSAVRRR
jgi:transglutaminase-like putative cysteine protease